MRQEGLERDEGSLIWHWQQTRGGVQSEDGKRAYDDKRAMKRSG